MSQTVPALLGWDEPRLVRLPAFGGDRGRLIPADAGVALPFAASRYFVLADVPVGAVRGGHAQRRGKRLLTCVAGSCTAEIRRGEARAVHRLGDPTTALYLPPWTWVECREFSPGAVVVVLCSEPYDETDQVADLATFLAGPDPA